MTDNRQKVSRKIREVIRTLAKICDTYKQSIGCDRYLEDIFAIFLWKYLSDQDFRVPLGTSYYEILKRCNEPNLSETVNQSIQTVSKYNNADITRFLTRTQFTYEVNSEATEQKDKLLTQLLESFNIPELDMTPSQFSFDEMDKGFRYWLSIFFPESNDINYKLDITDEDIENNKLDKVEKTIEFLSRPIPQAPEPRIEENEAFDESEEEDEDEEDEEYQFMDIEEYLRSLHSQSDLKSRQRYLEIQGWNTKNAENSAKIELDGVDKHRSFIALTWLNLLKHRFNKVQITVKECINECSLHASCILSLADRVYAKPLANRTSKDTAGKLCLNDDLPQNIDWSDETLSAKQTVDWLTHIIQSVKQTADRAIVIIPSGILHETVRFRSIRQMLVKEKILQVVVDLPSNLVDGNQSVSFCVIDQSAETKANANLGKVRFIDIYDEFDSIFESDECFDEPRTWFENCYFGYFNENNFSYWANSNQIMKKDCDLIVQRYIRPTQLYTEKLIQEYKNGIDILQQQINQKNAEIDEKMKLIEERILRDESILEQS